jgi:hypothetical protein
MADSAFLSRLPVKGAVFQSLGEADAFKVPLLDAEGKINLSLISNSATIYTAANTSDRLALSAATPGDFCTQSDNNSIYFLKTTPPSVENSWVRLSTIQDSEQDFDSPNFTGIPTAPTAPAITNSTQIATTAFVKNLAATEIPREDSTIGDIGTSIKFAKEDHSHPSDSSKASIDSPQFIGTPTAPNPDYTDNNTRLATTSYVKQQSIDGFTPARTNVNLNNFRITSLGTPINERDAATKAYVDALQSGLTVREPVRAATTPSTGNINLTGSTTTIDGVVLNNGDRVLVKNQTNAAQNGIYTVNLGGAWQRTIDADSSLEMKNGVYVFILDGIINKNSAWVLITSGNVNLNTTPLNFVYYTNQDANLILAGYGLIKETNTILVDETIVASVSLVATKQDTLVSGTNIKTLNNATLLGAGNIALDKSSVGLSNVDNTSDANKPVSTAQQNALDTKVDKVIGKQLSTEDFTNTLKTKLDGIAPGAEVNVQSNWTETNNSSDAFILNKPTTFPPSSHDHSYEEIYDFEDGVLNFQSVSSVANKTGAVTLTKTDVGLSNVDNTSDANKPVSTATQTALNAKVNTSSLGAANGVATLDANSKLTTSQLPNLAISEYLGTVATQAAMLALSGQKGDWVNRSDTGTVFIITGDTPSQIGSWTELNYPTAPVTSVAGKTGAVTLAKADVGLSNVDNTSDANKPVSTAQQTALNAKENTIAAGTTSQYWRGDKSWQTLDKTSVGLSNVDNTSDANKPVSTATQTALNAKENTITAGTTSQYWRGDKSWQTLNKSAVGLSNVDNTSDANKPVSTATQTALNAKQDTLVSGTNIKTINGNNILGSGDLAISTLGSLTVSPNVGLTLSEGNLSTLYNTNMSDTVESTTVGGAAPATASTWKTRTLVQVLDAILFPDVLPTYTNPTIILTGITAGTYEVGASIAQTLTLTGTKNDAGAFTNLSISRSTDGGSGAAIGSGTTSPTTLTTTNVADQFGYANPNNPNTNYSYAPTGIANLSVPSGTTSWVGSGNYSAGQAKKNNKGVTDTRTAAVRSTNAPQAAATGFQTSAITVTGIYPYYWGVSSTQPTTTTIAAAIADGTATRVLSSSSGTVTITFNANGQYIWFAHAGIYTEKTKWYNTELNQGSIGAGNFILAPVSQNMTANNGFWTGVSFKVYISQGATTTSGSIQFRNS